MPILARIDLTPGAAPPTLSIHLTRADGQDVAKQTLSFERTKQSILPITQGRPPEVARMLARMRARSPANREVAEIGRWLYTILFDTNDWRVAANVEPGAGPIELLLKVAGPSDLHNLPWEALHDGQTFLAVADPRPLAVSRVCGPGPTEVRLNPRVLFVIGDEMSEPKLQPGAEYYSVVRRLDADGRRLHTRILQRASLEALTNEIKAFDPGIVHLICHGEVGATGGYLLMYDDKGRPRHPVYAVPLARALQAGVGPGRSLPVLVLTACDSALLRAAAEDLADIREPTRSVAEELVRQGAPLAVGMMGRVAARACRLFAREFYATVARAGVAPAATIAVLTEAASYGRYWALTEAGAVPERSIDWTLPAVFRQEQVTVTADSTEYTRLAERATFADTFRTRTDPPLLCDRMDVYSAYRGLVGGDPGYALAVRLVAQHPKGRPVKYGLSRLLEELAYLAALDGHLPCLARRQQDPPHRLLLCILGAVEDTRAGIGLPRPAVQLDHLQLRILGQPAQLADEIERVLRRSLTPAGAPDPAHPDVLRAATEYELRRLAADARGSGRLADGRRVLLLIEDLHWYNQMGVQAAKSWLTRGGFAAEGEVIPIVLGYTTIDNDQYKGVPGLINADVERQKGYVGRLDLDQFPEAARDSLPYVQLLLGLDIPRVVSPQLTETQRGKLLGKIALSTDRAPSLFALSHNDGLAAVIEMCDNPIAGDPSLVPADDEAFLNRAREGARNGP